MKTTTAELICTGSELLNGSILNTHAQTTGERLRAIGVQLTRSTSLPDDSDTITGEVRAALQRSDVVIITGGLGPTRDDLTREAVAAALDLPLVSDADHLAALEAHYAKRNRRMTDDRKRMADKVQGSILLPNPKGSAPGHHIHDPKTATTILVLPGPPREFNTMLVESVLPILHAGQGESPVETLMVAGIGESEVERLLSKREIDLSPAELAFCANPLGLELRVSAPTTDALATAQETLRDALGHHVYATTRTLLPQQIGHLLLASGKTLAVAESCTGGFLGKLITDQPGISSVFHGGVIAYANEAKENLLDVPRELLIEHGAVSAPVAEAMAREARARLKTDFALSITGIAGPGGGSDEKPVGLVFIGFATPETVSAQRHILPGDRDFVRTLAAARAFDILRRHLESLPADADATEV